MRHNFIQATIIILLVCAGLESVSAQSGHTKNTYQLEASSPRPQASIEQVDWLVGNWLGTAFGNHFEEVWNPASAGTMVGFFKLYSEDQVVFYELLVLEEEEGSLSLKVKHFGPNFHAWESKEEFIDFKLVKIEPDAIHFSGLSFYRDGPNKIDGYIVMKGKDGAVSEEPLNYRRR